MVKFGTLEWVERMDPTQDEARASLAEQLLTCAVWGYRPWPLSGVAPLNNAAKELVRRLDQWEAEHGKERGALY